MDSGCQINWDDEKSFALLNPKMGAGERTKLERLSKEFEQKAHIWIASSGSSATVDQSVKFIALSKKAFLASATAVNAHLQSNAHDIWIQALPRFHVGGLSIETRSFLSGSSIVEGLQAGKWDAKYFFETIQRTKATLSALVPTQIFDLIQAGYRAPETMRAIVIGGSALSADILHRAVDLGWPLLPSYGLTECCSQVATAPLQNWKSKTGELELLSHIQARTNTEGVLQIQSDSLLTGFAQWIQGKSIWKDPKIQGWYQTEDLVDIEGRRLRPLGRGSDYVKISGEGVNLKNLQELLETIAQKHSPSHWKNIAVSAVEDSRSGAVLALAATNDLPALEIEKIQNEFDQKVAPYERIRKVIRVGEIPRTDLGKLARAKLKERLSVP